MFLQLASVICRQQLILFTVITVRTIRVMGWTVYCCLHNTVLMYTYGNVKCIRGVHARAHTHTYTSHICRE